MAYVNVPKDLTKIKSKVLFNLTKRQLICFGLAGAHGSAAFLFAQRQHRDDGCGNGDDRCHAPRFSVWGV